MDKLRSKEGEEGSEGVELRLDFRSPFFVNTPTLSSLSRADFLFSKPTSQTANHSLIYQNSQTDCCSFLLFQYNIPSRTSSSSFNRSSAAYSRPISPPPPRPSSRQNSIRSIHDLSSPQLPLPASLPSTGPPSSNTFTSGVLPPRAFFAPQQPRGAQQAAVPSTGSGGSRNKVEDVELDRVVGGFGRRGAESEDDDLEGDESELEGGGASAPRERRGSRFSLSKEGTGGSSGFTASREPLISDAVAGNGFSSSSPQTSPFQPPHPHYTTQQIQSQQRLSPSVQSQPTSPRSNPPPPLSLSPSSHPANLPHLANSPNHPAPTSNDRPYSYSPSTPFTPPPTPPTRKQNRKKTYNYQLHDSHNTFFLRGKLLTGGDSAIPFIISLALVLGLGGLWLGTTGVWIWREGVGGKGGRGGVGVVIVFAWVWGVALGGMVGTVSRASLS